MTASSRRQWQPLLSRSASTLAIIALSVCSTLLTQRLLGPQPASAQFISSPEIRAQSIVLTSSDGTTIARLGPGSSGAGNPTLFDASGRLRLAASGAGDLLAYGTGGRHSRRSTRIPKRTPAGCCCAMRMGPCG